MIEVGSNRYQPDSHYAYSDESKYQLDQEFLALLVGLAALGLPVLLLIATALGNCFFDSISHFYYAPFWGDVFVGILVFIGTFLLAYRGGSKNEGRLTSIAGFFPFGVAFFPTPGAGCEEVNFSAKILADLKRSNISEVLQVFPAEDAGGFFKLFDYTGWLHFGSATLFFGFLAYYSFSVFTRVIPDVHRRENGTLMPMKKIRNAVYIATGLVILTSMLAITLNALHSWISHSQWEWWTDANATFWFETFILVAFGLSWIVKGKFFGWLRDEKPLHQNLAQRLER